jgi:hypothetical protein
VPIFETDETYEGDLTELAAMAQALPRIRGRRRRAPPGAKMVLERVGGTDVVGSIKYHDEQLASVWEDQVGQLGQTQTGGNRALGQTFAGLQTLARRSVARWFASEFRERVIRQWFSYNVGERSPGSPRPVPEARLPPAPRGAGRRGAAGPARTAAAPAAGGAPAKPSSGGAGPAVAASEYRGCSG